MLWFVIATDAVIVAIALGLYFRLLPPFHPVLEQIPPIAYLLAAIVFSASIVLMLFMQKRLRVDR